ncbi:tetratricopeptide repeat protein, partial [Yoonia sp.]|uniref:tetratricopeptide repeat protein n=1 Tax=Yoonia sp. TaxID=2212373 RepID=UPI002E19857A
RLVNGFFMSILRNAVWASLLMLLSGSVATAQSFDRAMIAFDQGDYHVALEELLPLAERGDVLALYNVGMTYEDGFGDYAEAAKWYRLAAKRGDADAQTNLGHMYDNGQGVPQDDVQAVRWYLKAAEQGNATAQFNLGVMYRNGDGVPRDLAQAVKWYGMAAKQGDPFAQSTLGVMHRNGEGVPQDDVKAYMWYAIGDVNGFEGGDILRASVAQEMSGEDVSLAQLMAHKCLTSGYVDCDW